MTEPAIKICGFCSATSTTRWRGAIGGHDVTCNKCYTRFTRKGTFAYTPRYLKQQKRKQAGKARLEVVPTGGPSGLHRAEEQPLQVPSGGRSGLLHEGEPAAFGEPTEHEELPMASPRTSSRSKRMRIPDGNVIETLPDEVTEGDDIVPKKLCEIQWVWLKICLCQIKEVTVPELDNIISSDTIIDRPGWLQIICVALDLNVAIWTENSQQERSLVAKYLTSVQGRVYNLYWSEDAVVLQGESDPVEPLRSAGTHDIPPSRPSSISRESICKDIARDMEAEEGAQRELLTVGDGGHVLARVLKTTLSPTFAETLRFHRVSLRVPHASRDDKDKEDLEDNVMYKCFGTATRDEWWSRALVLPRFTNPLVVDIHCLALPLTAFALLSDVLHQTDSTDIFTVVLTCLVSPTPGQRSLIQQHVDYIEDSWMASHLNLLETLDKNGGNELMKNELLETLSKNSFVTVGEITTLEYTEMREEDALGCLVFKFATKRADNNAPSQHHFLDQTVATIVKNLEWRAHPELLHCNVNLAEKVLVELQDSLGSFNNRYYSDMLNMFEEHPLLVVSKFISILLPVKPTGKEYKHLIVSGWERLGKTPSLILATLIATTTPMFRIYEDAKIAVRTLIGSGPNTSGPENDFVQKFKDLPDRLLTSCIKVTAKTFAREAEVTNTRAVFVFGDSAGRAQAVHDVLFSNLKDQRGREIKWLISLDEFDHLMGRGLVRKSTNQIATSFGKAENLLRGGLDSENVLCGIHTSATALPACDTGPHRIFALDTLIHTVKLRATDTYYGAERLYVKYSLQKGDELLQPPHNYNSTHRCLDDFFKSSRPIRHGNVVVHPTMLMASTSRVNVPGGSREHAKVLSTGMLSHKSYDEISEEWVDIPPREPPVCIVHAGKQSTIYDGNTEIEGMDFLLKEYGNDVEVFGALASRASDDPDKRSQARSLGDHLQTLWPLVMKKVGLHRIPIILGYLRLQRQATVAFEVVEHSTGLRHVFYPTHAVIKIGVCTKEEEELYTRCIEDIRQLLGRMYTNSFGLKLDEVFGGHFRMTVCSSKSVPDDIRENMRLTDVAIHLLGLHHTLRKMEEKLNEMTFPVELHPKNSHNVKSTKKKNSVLTVRVRNPGELSEVKRKNPGLFETAVHRLDQLSVRQRIKIVTTVGPLHEYLEDMENEVGVESSDSRPHNVYKPDRLFDTSFTSEVQFTQAELQSLQDFFERVGLRRSKNFRQRRGGQQFTREEMALELLTHLLCFNFTWQQQYQFIPVTNRMRRNGCFVSLLLLGSLKTGGLSDDDLVALKQICGIDGTTDEAVVITTDLLDGGQLSEEVGSTFADFADLLQQVLSPALCNKAIESCKEYTKAFVGSKLKISEDGPLRLKSTLTVQSHYAANSNTLLSDLRGVFEEEEGVSLNEMAEDVDEMEDVDGWVDEPRVWSFNSRIERKHVHWFCSDLVAQKNSDLTTQLWYMAINPWLSCLAPKLERQPLCVTGLIVAAVAGEVEDGEFEEDVLEKIVNLYAVGIDYRDLVECRKGKRKAAHMDDDEGVIRIAIRVRPGVLRLTDEWKQLFSSRPSVTNPLAQATQTSPVPIALLQNLIGAEGKLVEWATKLTARLLEAGGDAPGGLLEAGGGADRGLSEVQYPLPDEGYRNCFDEDLRRAALLPKESWRTMSLTCKGKNGQRLVPDKTWCLVCHLFISNAVVRRSASVSQGILDDFALWYGQAAPRRDQLIDLLSSPVWFSPNVSAKKWRRPWRAFCGGVHVFEEAEMIVIAW